MPDNLPSMVKDIDLVVPSENLGKKILLFGKIGCPDCERVKKFFTENAIEFEFHDIEKNKNDFKWLTSFATFVPVVVMLDGTLLYTPSNSILHQKILEKSINGKVKKVEEGKFDTIIIGAGPAGITAAIYAVRKSLKVLVLSKNIGGQAIFASNVENFPGFTLITGTDLVSRFRLELEQFKGEGLWLKEGVEITGILGKDDDFEVLTDEGGKYFAKTIIIASGRIPKLLNIRGENEFFGKGVATCATCDAPLFKGREVVVVGGGNSALDAAYSLSKVASHVTILNKNEDIEGDAVLKENVLTRENISVLNHVEPTLISGSKFVESISIKSITTSEERVIGCQGIFIEIGWIPETKFDTLTRKKDSGEIIVDEYGHTSVAGIWACGDVDSLWGEQIIIAAGKGAKTALSVSEHISKIPHQPSSNLYHG